MFLVTSCCCVCPIHWSQAFSQEWRCRWSIADNYIWQGACYIRGLTVMMKMLCGTCLHSIFCPSCGHLNADDGPRSYFFNSGRGLSLPSHYDLRGPQPGPCFNIRTIFLGKVGKTVSRICNICCVWVTKPEANIGQNPVLLTMQRRHCAKTNP